MRRTPQFAIAHCDPEPEFYAERLGVRQCSPRRYRADLDSELKRSVR